MYYTCIQMYYAVRHGGVFEGFTSNNAMRQGGVMAMALLR